MSRCRTIFAIAWLALTIGIEVNAEVMFDGSTGGPQGLLSGDLTIVETDGIVTPANDALLHSFELFNVLAGESVTFTHVTPTINNILLRVTGAQASLIEGQLESDASLWLLNPNGVLFGEQAMVDVMGSFRTNTRIGDSVALVLNDGSLFSVDTNLNTLSVANPADFGFVAESLHSVEADSSLATSVQTSAQGSGNYHVVSGGTPSGSNLFHSFSQFSVFANDSVEFVSPLDSELIFTNVISRVTGATRSFLTGTVQTSGDALAGASFWLVNPAGLFVGNGAQLNVGQGLHLGAADGITFHGSDDMVFGEQSSVADLFASEPQGFSFLAGGMPGTLTIDGLLFDQNGKTGNGRGAGVTLAGGDVLVNDTVLRTVTTPGVANRVHVKASEGSVLLANSVVEGSSVGTANAGRVLLEGARLLANGTRIELTTTGGNTLDESARIGLTFSESVQLVDTTLRATTLGEGASGAIVSQTQNFLMSGGVAETRSRGEGISDGVIVSANGRDAQSLGSILLANGAQLRTDTQDAQNGAGAGLLALDTDGSLVLAGSFELPIQLNAEAGPMAAESGLVFVRGQTVVGRHVNVAASTGSLVDIPALDSSTGTDDTTGAVQFHGIDSLELANSDISVSTTGTFDAGNLLLDGLEIELDSVTLSSSSTSAGNAGAVDIGSGIESEFQLIPTALSVSLSNSRINATSSASGASGTVTVSSDGDLTLSATDIEASSSAAVNGGSAGDIGLAAGGTASLEGSRLRATVQSGTPGFISVVGRNTRVAADSLISIDTASSQTSTIGINLAALELLQVEDALVSSNVSGSGDASPIQLGAMDVNLVSSDIRASSTGAGNAGLILIDGGILSVAQGAVRAPVAERLEIVDSSLQTTTSGSGSFGQIALSSLEIDLVNSSLEVETSSVTAASSAEPAVSIVSSDLGIDTSDISARTSAAGDAGSIVVSVLNELTINRSEIASSSTGSGAAGVITLVVGTPQNADSGQLLVENSRVISDTRDGTGGEINLVANGLRLTGPQTLVSTNSSGSANAGNLRLLAMDMSIDEGAAVESRATGVGNSNSVNLLASGSLAISGVEGGQRARVSTNSLQSQGGDVVLQSGGLTFLNNADLVASADADGSGGNIRFATNGLLTSSSSVLAQAVGGNGGRIDIQPALGSLVIIDGQSALNADSATGTSGTVDVDAPDTGIVSALTHTDARLAPEARLNQDECGIAARQAGMSSLVVRDAVDHDPFASGYLGSSGTPSRTTGGCQ